MKARWTVTAVTAMAAMTLSGLAAPSWGAVPGREARAARAAEPEPQVTETEAARAARESGRPVEVLGLRGETREVQAQPQGGFVAVEHLEPVRTLKDGKWVGIDTTLRREADGTVVPAATTVDLRLSGGGDAPMLSMTRAGRRMSLSWPGRLPAPDLEGDTAVYRGVLGPDVDLRVRATADGASHVLVVKTPEAARDPRLAKLQFGLSAPDLRLSADERGDQTAVDPVTGAEVFSAPPPKMWDSSGPAGAEARAALVGDDGLRRASAAAPGDTSRVAVMKMSAQAGRMSLEPDQGLLTSPDAKFPIYIDPMWYSPGESARLMVSSGGWEQYNFTGDEGMGRCPISLPPAGAYCGSSHVKRLFYRMPTSRFAGKQIISAEFSVKETWAPSCDGRSVHIYRTTAFGKSSTWSSTSDNWADYLTYRDVAKGHSSSCPAGDVIFNVESAVKEAAKKGWSSTTFGLRAGHEDDEYGWKRFDHNATLRVYYNSPPPQPKMSQLHSSPGGPCPAYGHTVPVNRLPMLYADNLTDPDNSGAEGEKLTAEFLVTWKDTSGTEHRWDTTTPKKQSAKGSHKSSFSVQVPAGLIPANTDFDYQVRSYDGAAWSPWSWAGSATSCYLRYDPTAPRTPAVTSWEYPQLNPDDPDVTARDGVGRYGSFTITFDPEVTKFAYALDTAPAPASAVNRTAASQTIQAVPAHAGVNTLYVTVWDAAGNFSVGDHRFWVSEGAPERARWKLDEPAGSTSLTGETAGIPARSGAGATLGAEGKVGKGLTLDGYAGGYAATDLPVVDTTKGFTVSAWVRLRKNDAFYNVLAQDASTQSGFQLGVNPAPASWVFKTPANDVKGGSGPWTGAIAPTPPELNTWTHLTGVYDASAKALRLYVNGVKAAETPVASVLDARGAFQIGRSLFDGGYANNWPGDVDEVKVFAEALSDDDAASLAAGTTPDGRRLTAHWRLEEPAGNERVYGEGGGPITATTQGDVTLGVPGQSGTAMQLTGPGAYASTAGPVLDTTGNFAVAAWVKLPTTTTTDMTIVSQEGVNQSGFYLKYRAANKKWAFMRAAGDVTAPATLTAYSASTAVLGQWTHLVGVQDVVAGKLRIYVNGVESGTNSLPPVWQAGGGLQIGRSKWNGTPVDQVTGAIDDVRVYDRVLSAEEAQDLFAVKSDVFGRWRLNAAAGTPATSPDSAPVAVKHPLVLAGAAKITANAVVTPPDGQAAGALDLPGGDGDYATADGAVIDSAESFTVSAWVQTAGTPTRSMTVLGLAGATNSAVAVRYDATKGHYVLDVPSADGAGATTATVDHSGFHQGSFGDWDHLAVVYDGFNSRITLYVNGVREDAAEAPTVSYRENTRVFAPITSLQLGRARTGGAYPAGQNWRGQLDDVWVLRGAATEEEVAYLANPTEIDEL
ncbi:LamG-like jellyroll fold domain-containing protein [Sphaerisporangium fuscum]|uniref:LamG-like jellyroll fold domain-containing protein n=1 Tax=Sphaerisporangium fuscum TaxID=2835868 RepID=UPI001BDC1742|nr:LamG-like jellyroll fold domain-containing protein [Sphaerisporangium fuscum]